MTQSCPSCLSGRAEKHCGNKGCKWTVCPDCSKTCRPDGQGYPRSVL